MDKNGLGILIDVLAKLAWSAGYQRSKWRMSDCLGEQSDKAKSLTEWYERGFNEVSKLLREELGYGYLPTDRFWDEN